MSGGDRALVALAALAAAAWAAAPALAGPRPAWTVAIKALAVLPLGVVALRSPGGAPVGAALLVHAAGDVVIETRPILAALAVFGVGHLLYAAAFGRARRRWEEVGGGAKLRLGLLALAAGALLPGLGEAVPAELGAPVLAYGLALLAMAALAQIARRGQPWLAAGALAFVASDALLALDRFAGPSGWAAALVWPLYWSAQAAFALGWSRGERSAAVAGLSRRD